MYNMVRGTVYDPNDPTLSGRLRLLVPTVYGESPSGWAEPIVPPAASFKPKFGDVMWVFFENGDLTKPVYSSTAEITAAMIEATMVLASRIVVGDPEGQRFELNAEEVIATDPDGQVVFSLSPNADMFFQLIDSNGGVVAAINSTGDAVFNNLQLTGVETIDSDSLVLGGQTFTDVLAEQPRGMVVFGSRMPVVTGITSEFGLMEVDWTAPDDAGSRWHMIDAKVGLHIGGSAGDVVPVKLRVRFTKDGSQPDITSPVLKFWDLVGSGDLSEDFMMRTRWLPAEKVDPDDPPYTFKFLVTIEAPSAPPGIASISTNVEFYLTDVGQAPIPNVAKLNTGNGTAGSGGGGGGDTGDGGSHEPQHHTTLYKAVRGGTYNASGSLINTGSNLTQGYYSSTNGNQKAVLWFPFGAIQDDLSGATISKVELWLYSNHWYFNGGGTSVIGFHSDTSGSVPGSYSGVSGKAEDRITPRVHFPKPGGHWVNITANAPDDWRTGSKTGVILGPGPDQEFLYYGAFNGPAQSNVPQLRITYTTNA